MDKIRDLNNKRLAEEQKKDTAVEQVVCHNCDDTSKKKIHIFIFVE